jgi:4-amino-4-deoxy-L-arabinose transferase-like glycosyltransferase
MISGPRADAVPAVSGGARRMTAIAVALYVALLWPSLSDRMVNWRESDVLMVGRNFCRGFTPLWLPAVDHGGNGPGITGMELPLLSAVSGAIACGDPRQTYTARAVVLGFSLAGILALAVLARRHLGPRGAWIAVFGYAFSPLVFFYGRTVQPDVPALSLGLVGLWLFDAAVPANRPSRFGLYLGSAAAIALGALVKLPVVVFGLPLVVLLWERRGLAAARAVRYWLYLPVALTPVIAWYAWARHLVDAFGYPYFFLGSSFEALVASWRDPSFYNRIFLQGFFDAYVCPAVAVLGVGSFLLPGRRGPPWLLAMLLAAIAFFFLAGESAAWHTVYGIIAVPSLCLAAGAAVDALSARLPRRIGAVAVALLVASTPAWAFFRTKNWFTRQGSAAPFDAAKAALDGARPKEDRVLLLSNGNPRALWLLDRKGWMSSTADLDAVLHGARPSAAAIEVSGIRGWLSEAHEALARAGYKPLAQGDAVEVWLLADRT